MRTILIVATLLCVVGSCNAKSVVSNSVSLKSSKSDFSVAIKAAAPAAKGKASSGKAVAAVSSDGLKETLKLVGLFTLW